MYYLITRAQKTNAEQPSEQHRYYFVHETNNGNILNLPGPPQKQNEIVPSGGDIPQKLRTLAVGVGGVKGIGMVLARLTLDASIT